MNKVRQRPGCRIVFPIRPATNTESTWFARNPNVRAYASSDGAVVFNPHQSLSKNIRRSLYVNESVRLFLRKLKITPSIEVTASQLKRFQNTPYEHDLGALRQTLVA